MLGTDIQFNTLQKKEINQEINTVTYSKQTSKLIDSFNLPWLTIN